MVARHGLAFSLITFCALTIGACSPAPRPLLAVGRSANGQPVAVVHPCHGDPVVQVSVFENDSVVIGPSGSRFWRAGNFAHPVSDAADIALVTPAPGWETTAESTLQVLEPEHIYAAGVGTSSGRRVYSVMFRLAQIADLHDDEVLVFDADSNDFLDSKVVTRDAFHRDAAKHCGRG